MFHSVEETHRFASFFFCFFCPRIQSNRVFGEALAQILLNSVGRICVALTVALGVVSERVSERMVVKALRYATVPTGTSHSNNKNQRLFRQSSYIVYLIP